MIMKTENFVFDIYGTLADIRTDENSPEFLSKMQQYFKGVNPEISDFAREYAALCAAQLNGKGEYAEADLLPVFATLSGGGGDRAMQAAQYFRESSRSRLAVYPHIRKTLAALKARGAKLYILSNAQSCFTLRELEKLKLTGYFRGIEISSDFGEKKPSPRFFGHLLNKYALNPETTVYIGNDYQSDILGATGAGLKAVYIKSNLSPADDDLDLIKKSAVFAAEDFASLSKFLLSL